MIEINRKRELYIDSSVFGMGRGAGNFCTELLTQFINENIEKKYDLIPVLEIMDEYIMPIYTTKPGIFCSVLHSCDQQLSPKLCDISDEQTDTLYS